MSATLRLVLFLYNLLLLALSGIFLAAAINRPEPLAYLQLALATPENRLIFGIAALLLLGATLVVFVHLFKKEPRLEQVVVKQGLQGEIAITVPAIKVLIMKAIKQIEGVRDIRPHVAQSAEGLVIKLHMAINPELSVPELSQQIQSTVKQYLQDIGGLEVAEIRILVDDIPAAGK
ncbi:MAG TPA: alkaline shock response membrane anchor protein AmaP [Syntrophomonas sp.]|jgi:uncharacterized alkaline shock family protein YloU|nr:alkaline shock response membrane anchor protein AmaP [Syntrophomonas sp.]